MQKVTTALRAALIVMLLTELGCVRNVTVCATYDRRLGKETPERWAKDSAGGSICAELEPPRLVRPAEPAETEELEAEEAAE